MDRRGKYRNGESAFGYDCITCVYYNRFLIRSLLIAHRTAGIAHVVDAVWVEVDVGVAGWVERHIVGVDATSIIIDGGSGGGECSFACRRPKFPRKTAERHLSKLHDVVRADYFTERKLVRSPHPRERS